MTLLVLGLALRAFIAGVYLPLSGFSIDIADFTLWAQRLASIGPAGFYEEGYFSDYPPGYLYVLWLLGGIGGALAPLVGQDATSGLVKIPGILADVGVAWLLFVIGRRWAGNLLARSRAGLGGETLGLAAATIYLFNPGVIFDSAVWGQIDSVGTLVVLVTIYALGRGWTEAAAVGAVLAMLVKFQFGFLIPIVAIVGIKRHLLGRSSDPVHAGKREPLRVVTSLALAFGSLILLLLPFRMLIYTPLPGGDPRGLLGILPEADPSRSLIGKLVEAASTYTGLTINAFNLWRNPWSGLGDTLHWGDDTAVGLVVGPLALTWQQLGALLFAVVALAALTALARRDDMRGVLLASLVVAIAFYVLPTRVHERYLFPALALAAPLVLSGRAWPWICAGLSLSFFANIYWVYSEDWSFAGRIINPGAFGQPMPQDPFLAATLFTDPGIWALSAMIVALLLLVTWRALRLAFAPEGAEPMPSPDPGSLPPPRRSWPSRAMPAPISRIGWLAPRAADAYLREPSRGVGRRDALILLGIVAFALVFRLWRLDMPRAQHFDEVYHARSAVEWLGSWQNGWDRDVYEWTHPMLAKYLIAAGIVAADPNRVVGSDALDEPSTVLAVAPARSSVGHERSLVFTLTGVRTIVASDAERGDEVARWEAGGPVASLAYDVAATRLLVGRADAGTLETYELAALLASPDGRAPPAGSVHETELEGVSQILVDASHPILLRGPGGVAQLDREAGTVTTLATGIYGGLARVRATDEGDDSVAVSDPQRNAVVLLSPEEGETDAVEIEGAQLLGPLLAIGEGDDQRILALTGPLAADDEHPATLGGIAAIDADGSGNSCGGDPCLIDLVPLPGTPALIGHQEVAGIVYVAGVSAEGEPQLWTLDPHVEQRRGTSIGLATFDQTLLPGTPLAMAFDVASTSEADDHGTLLVSTSGTDGAGEVVRVDAGSNAFAWRLAGAVFGALLAALVYLLAATMFSRRRIAMLAAAFVAIDGMTFSMSRIAMNDIFVAVFILAAYLAFWQIWSGRWARSAWWVLPLVGVCIGLAASTKWVGFYALAGLWVLVLARSDLGRLALVALVALMAVIGGVGAPWPFVLLMVGVVALALVITHARPIRLDVPEAISALAATGVVIGGVGLAFALAYDTVEGRNPGSAVEYLFALLARGAQAGWPAYLMLAVAALLLGWRAWSSLRDPASDARWYRPGQMGGFGWAWIGACLLVIPLTVYGLSYVPYLQLGHDWALSGGPGYGWSLDELHAQMYGYHYNLTAGHASSSPWWSWPLALKPVWFSIDNFDAQQVAVIYNGQNPILAWAGVPALVACGILAWKRRSMALVLLVVAFAFQFVPWVRIERATFAYHYLTAVVFAMVAIAYLVDELLRRPAWRDVALGYLALVAVVGVLVYPLGSALAMPDWYINAARALPPWNYGFQFPGPPSGEREELLSVDALKLVAGGLLAMGAMAWALYGRWWLASLLGSARLRRRVAD
ncbi:MAG TPA: phospholipid carrier-dependent glycosyltransferase [Methylomirabilota bacterium]|nr:phospholipid carrier-dependent glycosyltransferase [Methylomirabilota bacterium]